MPKIYDNAESVETIASGLIPNYHPELATARMLYIFVDKASTKGGRELLGKVRKLSGMLEFIIERDFIVEVALDKWNELDGPQRAALVDHLLERCTGEEEEESAKMIWKIREPDVQEFSSILQRHGAWHEDLRAFVSVAQQVQLDDIIQQEADVDLETVETDQTTN